jgi:hypothetical protein
VTLSNIQGKLDELLEIISKCENKKPRVHREILRNYARAFYFGFISEVQFKNIEKDIELLEGFFRN